MAYDKADTERLLALVEKHVKSSPEYSQEDWDALHSMARAWLGIVAFGRLGKWLITTLGLFAAAAASFTALVHFLKDWR